MFWALLLINILCIVLCYQIAQKRQSNAGFWAVMGLLFGPVALPFVFFSMPKTTDGNKA